MKTLYMLVRPNGAEWEDNVLYDSEADAIAASLRYKNATVQIFHKKEGTFSYLPSYDYYENGVLVRGENNNPVTPP